MPSDATGTTIIDVLRTNAHADPDRVACILRMAEESDVTISRGDLWRRSASFARRLLSEGGKPGESYIIALKHGPDMLYAFFGAMIAGLVPSFMPFPTAKQKGDLFWGSHRSLFERIGAKQFLTYRANADMAAAVPHDATLRYAEDVADWFATADDTPPASPQAHDIALLQHTSGTTGLKKGVMLSHAAILRHVSSYAEHLGFGEDDVIASWLPVYHDMGLIACLMMPLVVGARIVMLDPFDWITRPTCLLDLIEQERATFCWLPNFAFLLLTRAALPGRRWNLSSIRAFINASEPCKPTTFERFRNRFDSCGLRPTALQILYGMAENVFAVTQTRLETTPRVLEVDADVIEAGGAVDGPPSGRTIGLLSCGPAVADTEITIRNADRTPVADGQIGEVSIRSSCLFSGYNKLPEQTAQKIVDGWYYTGDLGLMNEAELFVTGRKDDLMIVYGRNYYAHAVEQCASECPGVVPGRTVAFAVDNEATGSRDAVLLVEADGTCPEQELRRLVKSTVFDTLGLALHTVGVRERGVLVKSTAGKISRHHNKKLYTEDTHPA